MTRVYNLLSESEDFNTKKRGRDRDGNTNYCNLAFLESYYAHKYVQIGQKKHDSVAEYLPSVCGALC